MKIVFVSDIHGCYARLKPVLSFFDEVKADMLCIGGDIINYGPRNGIPSDGLDPNAIADALNARSGRIVAVRGNCDSEVDQMLLKFPIMSDYCILVADGTRVFLTHGHKFNEENLLPQGADILFYGHTHLWKLEKDSNGILLCNTGSITFPKGGNPPTFATIDEDSFVRIRDLEGNVLKEKHYTKQ